MIGEKKDNLWHEAVQFNEKVPVRIFKSIDYDYASVAPHFHEDLEIIYLSLGSLQVMEGTEYFTLQPNQIHIFNSNIVHGTLFEGKKLEGIVLQISYSFLRKICPDIDYYTFSEKKLSENHFHYTSLIEGMNQLLIKLETQDEFTYLSAFSLLFQIIENLMRNSIQKITSKEVKINQKYFERNYTISNFIKEKFKEQISLIDLANELNLNSSYLSRFIKKNFGMTFYEYLSNVRLTFAYGQLTHSDTPIMQIVEESGFRSYVQFSKDFKKKYGVTPREIRKKLR